MDLTTTARVQRLLESGGASVGQHATLLGDLIPAVSARIEEYLGRGAETTSRTEYFDTEPTLFRVVLHAYPVSSVAQVRYDTLRVYDSSAEVASSEYAVDTDRGFISFDRYGFVVAARGLKVVYTGGMAATTDAFVAAFPAIAHACDLQVASLIQRRLALGATSVNAGGGSKAWVGGYDLLPEVKAILDLYRRMV